MENNKETAYKGFVLNGFMALILEIVLIFAAFLAMDNDIPALGIPAILLFFMIIQTVCLQEKRMLLFSHRTDLSGSEATAVLSATTATHLPAWIRPPA